MIKVDKSASEPDKQAPDAEEQAPAAEAPEDDLAAQVAELNERMLRQAAELDNYKKRTEREKADFFKRANEGLVKDLLPVLDNLERALESAADSPEAGGNLAQGVQMIRDELLKVLERHGLEPMEAMGQPFDPELHEAMMQQENPELDENTVMAEAQKGYLFQGRLLRPAMVVVSKK
ncbi:MAG: nucleotide exchange factor GrpE [Desulfarculaceae bacterium]|nr:nucleotide exchange factor GrpE [Desulfarculaceae bacterium]MCF8073418.1 nucleotide exchange factor GrpE [Desulfarculaceae bacterium]MCF8100435.1 nucleotide exchange factor GrpE [Desulfarculaceae bacterium]MCF8115829.1 nucleotide exchange factor GrpE [Desulfarculaceae bacterium]